MSLTWDLTDIKDYNNLCWFDNDDPNKKEGENFRLNPVTEALIHLSMFTGITKITKNNYKELAKRLMELEIIGSALLPVSDEALGDVWTSDNHVPSTLLRNPRPDEVEQHIGLVTNVAKKDNKKWGNEVRRMVREQAEEFIAKYNQESNETLENSDETSA